MNRALTIAKINLRQIKAAYFITGLVFLLMLVNSIVMLFIPGSEGNSTVSPGNTFALLPIFAAIFIPASNLRKTIHLGVRRNDFFKGCLIAYALLSAAVTLIILLLHYTIDRYFAHYISEILDMFVAFGFLGRGPAVAFIQMFAFFIFLTAFTHTLTMAQTAWYGWLADVVIVAIISVFTPIAPLRAALVWFFNLIIFGNPVWQVLSCLILAALIYSLSKPVLNRKKI